MRKMLLQSVALAAIIGWSLPIFATGTQAAEPSALAIFVFDISDSVATTVSPRLAGQAGELVREHVARMQPGDRVMMRSLGAAGIAARQIHLDVELGRKPKTRPRRIAPQLGRMVASMPQLVKDGQLQLQTQTNIIGFVELLAPSLDCENRPTRIVIFSDGIEFSTLVNGNDLLKGNQDLPPPSREILAGCHVEMRGLGQQTEELGTDTRWYIRLRDEWTRFFTAAGVESFKAYGEIN